ncbi:PepSY domain-containing protein [Roseibium sp. HPY-6]|uniref:PepSY domain-containing protein n=1 Tax=Roseibium sp. HPY-6 TaxID=3229852 RepID=UPI00338F5E95
MDNKLIFGSAVAGVLMVMGASGAIAAKATAEAPALDETRAIEIALAEVPGTVQETELEREDGKQVYEIEILTADGLEMEVEIDAETGAVLEVEADGDDDDDDAKSAG